MFGGWLRVTNIADRVGAGEATLYRFGAILQMRTTGVLGALCVGGQLWWLVPLLALALALWLWARGMSVGDAIVVMLVAATSPDLLLTVFQFGPALGRRTQLLAASRAARIGPFAAGTNGSSPSEASAANDTLRIFKSRVAYREGLQVHQRATVRGLRPLSGWIFSEWLVVAIVAMLILDVFTASGVMGLVLPSLIMVMVLLLGGIVLWFADVGGSRGARQSRLCDTRRHEGCCVTCGAYLLRNVPDERADENAITIARCHSCDMEWPLIPPAMPDEIEALLATQMPNTAEPVSAVQ